MVQASPNLEEFGAIPREDVAEMILAVLAEQLTIGKAFNLTSGDNTIKDALKKLP